MKVSVIIPTYNRSRLIGLTLKSFIKQNFEKQNFEIIVADNNSADNTGKIVSDFIDSNKDYHISYFVEKRQGVHYARNSAAKLAKGDYLYFTDDDMIADGNLITELLYLFELDKRIASVTGSVLPKWEATPPLWILKLCNNSWLSLNNPPYELLVSEEDCNVYSCHQMIKREVFFSSGGFNPENTKGEWIGDGETGLNIKVKEMGGKFAFNRKSIIYHIIPASRLTQSYLNKRLQNQGNCDSYTDYRRDSPSRKSLINQQVKFGLKLIYTFLNFIRRIIFFDIRWRLNFSYCYYYIARIKYNRRLVSNSAWREMVLKRNWIDD